MKPRKYDYKIFVVQTFVLSMITPQKYIFFWVSSNAFFDRALFSALFP